MSQHIHLSHDSQQKIRKLLAINPKTKQSIHPHEFSGCFRFDQHSRIIHIDNIHRHRKNIAVTPSGSITWHSHNVPDGSQFSHYMSTDVPSWQDIVLMMYESITRGLLVHVVFTPSFIHSIHIPHPMRHMLMQKNASYEDIQKIVEPVYKKVFQRHGSNYGHPFTHSWLNAIQHDIHLDIVSQPLHSTTTMSFPYHWLYDSANHSFQQCNSMHWWILMIVMCLIIVFGSITFNFS
jgi:hypothetical protein